MIDPHAAYQALAARDPRFDGVFFVGVTSTGIYCRPVCPAKTPVAANCRFFASAEAAEKAAFRPCLRCRPELAPGHAPVDKAQRIAHRIVHGIHEGLADEGASLEEIASRFGLSSRQLRRIVQQELGVSPIELLQTRRLLLAKQLLTETRLPVTEIAFASGFSSLRRFNDAFLRHYRMPPTRLRKEAAGDEIPRPGDTSTLLLTYRPPYDWEGTLGFLRHRAILGVELVTDTAYSRTVRLGNHRGWITVTHDPAKRALRVEFTHTLAPVLPTLLDRLRNLFDLTARPDLIAGHLAQDERLREAVLATPGLRVPGAFGGFELAVRAILGQQVTVKAATTLAGRFARAFGEEIATPFPELTHLTPRSETIAQADPGDIAALGVVGARAASLIAVARAFRDGSLRLDPGGDPDDAIARLVALPGIGPWTAHYIAMRALRWPDSFPKEDIALRKSLGGVSSREAEALSQAWRPWRSYAVIHLWRSLSEK
ncbi:AlkA N-terminal domain-containing protein [Luteolibacter sp. LG18]|uniref:AlkA N-terminal domain-containing protein n=1 Tax=Luteolibacter sp. LG18 TaxID=2819286 RepID=UPI002B2C3F6C|nr:AraC family transcriptional regulator [Luteolibacter sp. LG18]